VRDGTLGSYPRRVTLRVRIPADLLAQVDRHNTDGAEQAIVLGNLVAEVLPDALAEVAREVLHESYPDTRDRPGASIPGPIQRSRAHNFPEVHCSPREVRGTG
jgi:uncharacterized protein YejL (UPF0352 family)